MNRIFDRFRSSPGTRANLPPINSEEAAAQRLSFALLLMATVIVAGTLGFIEVEGWDTWRAFYFTLITITTVGYGDEGLSDEGKKFASILLMGGVLSASYTLGMIVQASVANQLAWKKRMHKRISRLKNHTIVCGFGRMGLSVARRLAARQVPFVVIEQDTERMQRALELGYLSIHGNASEEEFLIAARIEKASHVVAAVDNVAENILITMECRDLSPDSMIIARAERDEDIRKLRRAGVDRVLCPFKTGGGEVADYITRPNVADFLSRASLGEGGVALAEIRIGENSELVGKVLCDMGTSEADRLSFVALETCDGVVHIPPGGKSTLAPGDLLIVAGDPDQVAEMNGRSGQGGLAA